MSDDGPSSTEIVVARDYEKEAIVVETPNHEQRLSPSAARQFAKLIRAGGKLPASPFSGGGQLANELEDAADDVEDGA